MGLNSLHNLFLRIKTGIGNCTHWQDPGKCHHLDMEMRHSRRYLHNSGQEALEKVSQGYIMASLHSSMFTSQSSPKNPTSQTHVPSMHWPRFEQLFPCHGSKTIWVGMKSSARNPARFCYPSDTKWILTIPLRVIVPSNSGPPSTLTIHNKII